MFEPSLTDISIDHLNLGLVFLEDDRIVECNTCFQEIVGKSADLLIGGSFETLLSADSVDLLADAMSSGSRNFSLTVQTIAVDEIRWLRLSYRYNPEYTNCTRLLVVEDVTDKHLKDPITNLLSFNANQGKRDSIFSSITTGLSAVFGAKYTFIAMINGDGDELDIKALTVSNELQKDPGSFAFAKTPSADVLTYGQLIISSKLSKRYGLDKHPMKWKAEAFIGVALKGRDGRTLGLIAVLDEKPMRDQQAIYSALQLYSSNLVQELERREMEMNLNERETKYRNLLDSAFEAKVIYDSKTDKFLDTNKAACDLFGYSPEEFLKLDPMAIRTPYLSEKEAKQNLKRAVKQALVKGTFVEETHNLTKEELVLETEITISPLNVQKGQVAISFRDITSRKKAERELENYRSHLEKLVNDRTSEIEELNRALMSTNEDLEKSNEGLHQQKEELHSALNDLKLTQEQLIREEKMSSLGVLTSGIAHEINNSLNLIGGGMNQIKLEMGDIENLSEEIREEMENGLGWINDGMKRVMGIVGGLSSYGQYRASIRKKVNLNELMESVISLHKTRMDDDIKLDISLDTPCEIEIYSDHLHKALLNILDNATYFTINTKRRSKKKVIEVITKELDKDNVHIEFRNYGDCIPEEIKSKIFDPFFTTKELGKGIGLGLTVAYSFVKRHNGKVEAINHKNGVSFVLTIPKEMKL